MTNKITPNMKNAAILPAAGIFLISNINNLIKVIENSTNEMILSVLFLLRMPSHIIAKDSTPHKIGSTVLI